MKKEDLFKAIGDIDDELININNKSAKKKNNGMRVIGFVSMAACSALIIGGALFVINSRQFNTKPDDNETTTQTTVEPGKYEEVYIPGLIGYGGCGDETGCNMNIDDYVYELENTIPDEGLEDPGSYTPLDQYPIDGINFGPLLPMTFEEKNEWITANRNMTYDFSDSKFMGYATILDEYVLTNTSETEQTITYLYPYPAYRNELVDSLPNVKIEGENKTPSIINGINAMIDGENTMSHSLVMAPQHYISLIGDDMVSTIPSYDEDMLNKEATVYEFSLDTLNHEMEEREVYVIRCDAETGKTIFSADMYISYEYGDYLYMIFSADKNSVAYRGGTPKIIFTDGMPKVYGEYIGKYDEVGDITSIREIELNEKIYDKTVKDILKEYCDRVLKDSPYKENELFTSLYYNDVYNLFSQMGKVRVEDDKFEVLSPGQYVGIGEYVEEEYSKYQFFMLVDDITIPAGESVTVKFEYDRMGSFLEHMIDENESKQGIYGYDNFINLGTNISFGEQVANIEDEGNIEMVTQNYGFDLENDIRTVNLSLDIEQYYMYVRFLSDVDE